jgi:hypothetical protein
LSILIPREQNDSFQIPQPYTTIQSAADMPTCREFSYGSESEVERAPPPGEAENVHIYCEICSEYQYFHNYLQHLNSIKHRTREDNQEDRKRENPNYCFICFLDCQNTLNYEQHLEGHNHLQREKGLFKSSITLDSPPTVNVPRHATCFFCNTCQIDLLHAVAYGTHINGATHLLNLDKQRSLWCSICKVQCTDSANLQLHTAGFLHTSKIVPYKLLMQLP